MGLLSISVMTSMLSYATVTENSYSDIGDSAHWQSFNGETSLLMTALEEDGLAVFNNAGKQIQHIQSNEAVGADVAYGIASQDGDKIDVVAVALADDDSFVFYRIDANHQQPLHKIGQFKASIKVQGVCLGKNLTTGELYAHGFSDNGDWVQFKLHYNGKIIQSALEIKGKATPVRHTKVGGKLSACVVDNETSTIYLAEQNVGIWQYGADPENVKERRLVDVVKPLGHLSEVESMDIAYQENGKGLIIVADEGEGFLLYDRSDHGYLNKFVIEGVEEAKLVTVANNRLWIGNTEIDEPVYQTLSFDELVNLGLHDVSDYVPAKWMNKVNLKNATLSLVKASAETEQVDKSGDAADDPALWYNQHQPEQSLIIATNKKGGLLSYSLDGKEVQYVRGSKMNNVDIRQGVIGADGRVYDIVAASNRTLNSIALYTLSSTSLASNSPPMLNVVNVVGHNRHTKAPELATKINNIYGLCMGKSPAGVPYVFINSKDGEIEQWRITLNNGLAMGKLVRRFRVSSQPEGCVVDDKTQTLYVGEENVAIWSFDARETGAITATLFAKIDGEKMVADIEGLTLYQTLTDNFLLASSQGNNTYALFDLNKGGEFIRHFAIIGDDGKGVDGTSDSDGIHATSLNLGPDYPQGVFIAQDWYNLSTQYKPLNQNFKIVDWRDINNILP